jgi:2-amino-4-hydroxy-6-hydroxymethyldihydropteridine diphosphokinase
MKAVISLGSNIGEPEANLDLAVALLREATDVIAVSSYLQTKPVGGPEQPDYLNAVAIIESELPAKELLALLNGIETAMGRTREIHWGPRVIDLDLIQYGGLLVHDEKLTLPHPRAHERRFVLAPWFEIEPEAILLTHGRISDLLNTDLE